MEDENLQNQNEIQTPQIEPISKTDAIVGVFTEPGNTFENIAKTKGTGYWVYPLLICVVFGLISAFIMNSDPQITAEINDKARAKMNEEFEKKIKAGEMSKEDAEKSTDMALKVTAVGRWVSPLVFTFIGFILMSAIYFVILKILKSQIEFGQVMNVVGLTMIISSIGGVIAIVLSVALGHLVSVSPGIFITEAGFGAKVHTLASHFDLFSIWGLIITLIGIARTVNTSIAKAAIVVLIPWIIWVTSTTLMS